MNELSIEQMEMVSGGGQLDCALAIGSGTTAVFGLAFSLAATGIGLPLGVGVSLLGMAFTAIDVYRNGDPC